MADDSAKVRVVAASDKAHPAAVSSNNTQAIKVGAKLDPRLTGLVQQMKELAQQTPHGAGHIRIMPTGAPNALPAENCACGCSCS